jgi:hypothetical protein
MITSFFKDLKTYLINDGDISEYSYDIPQLNENP